jgi:hypothetical protein
MKLGACNMRRMQSLLCVEEHLLNWRNTLQYYELGPPLTTINNKCVMQPYKFTVTKHNQTSSRHPNINKPNQRSHTQFWQPRSIFAMDHASPHHKILVEIYSIRADLGSKIIRLRDVIFQRHSYYKWLCMVATRNVMKKMSFRIILIWHLLWRLLNQNFERFLWSKY